MKISLVCCTLGDRPAELARFLDSIVVESAEVEVIVVDQSPDGLARPLCEARRERLSITFLQGQPGLSRARNVALPHVTGDIVAFPDDDCWYAPDTLEAVLRHFAAEPGLTGLSGCWVNEHGVACGHPWPQRETPITRNNVWKTAISFTLFFRAKAVRHLSFDPRVGVGSGTAVGAGEETLYLLTLLGEGARIGYYPDVRVHHPWRGVSSISMAKAYRYAIGFGHVAKVTNYPMQFMLPRLLVPLARSLGQGMRCDARAAKYHLATAAGRLVGVLFGERLIQRPVRGGA